MCYMGLHRKIHVNFFSGLVGSKIQKFIGERSIQTLLSKKCMKDQSVNGPCECCMTKSIDVASSLRSL